MAFTKVISGRVSLDCEIVKGREVIWFSHPERIVEIQHNG